MEYARSHEFGEQKSSECSHFGVKPALFGYPPRMPGMRLNPPEKRPENVMSNVGTHFAQ